MGTLRKTIATYDRVSRVYDVAEACSEWLLFRRWRRLLFGTAGGRILEVGVGTGKNIPYYPPGASVVAIDVSPGMMRRARRRASRAAARPTLLRMDVQHLASKPRSFDCVLASFVFCSVPDPLSGLREAGRVCKPDGRVLLLEHVRGAGKLMGRAMDLLNPLCVRLAGVNINRDTAANVQHAGLELVSREDLWGGVFKLIRARPGAGDGAPGRQ